MIAPDVAYPEPRISGFHPQEPHAAYPSEHIPIVILLVGSVGICIRPEVFRNLSMSEVVVLSRVYLVVNNKLTPEVHGF